MVTAHLDTCPVFSHGAQEVFHVGWFYPGECDVYIICSVGFSGDILNVVI